MNFKPAKKRGWEKIQISRDLTLMIGEVREFHRQVGLALTEDRFSDALDNSLKATLRLQETIKAFVEMKLGRYGYDLRALIDRVEEEDEQIWPHVMRTMKEKMGSF